MSQKGILRMLSMNLCLLKLRVHTFAFLSGYDLVQPRAAGHSPGSPSQTRDLPLASGTAYPPHPTPKTLTRLLPLSGKHPSFWRILSIHPHDARLAPARQGLAPCSLLHPRAGGFAPHSENTGWASIPGKFPVPGKEGFVQSR